jgi:Polyketide cyclase / dehydrase and lipid transport
VRIAQASATVALPPEAALTLWRDPDRWASFVEGFARVVERSRGWPAVDERIVWESIAGGRGRVTEKVVEAEPDRFSTLVFEDALLGRQTLRAVSDPGGARVELAIEYTLTRYGPLGFAADALFIRRALRDALRRTLYRFAIEAEEEAGLR